MTNITKSASDWEVALSEELQKPHYQKLKEKLKEEYSAGCVYPASDDVFNALLYAPLNTVSVVIVGQDPYHGGQAHGLSFSVKPGVEIPPSLNNIFKEIHDDVGCSIPNNGCLIPWAKQGVLLLNTVLTVRAHEPNSHAGLGWEKFTDRIIFVMNSQDRPIVFML